MRTKTPQQISDQHNRMLNRLFCIENWIDVDFDSISEAERMRFNKISDIAMSYIDNIFSHHNCKNCISAYKDERYRYILHNAAETREIYAGY